MEKLFALVYEKTKEFKLNEPTGDGLKFWKPIKKILSQYDNTYGTLEWSFNKNLSDKYLETVLNEPEKIINGKNETKIVEHNHYLIQIFRIPLKEKLNLRKLCQIALNLGQLYAFIKTNKEKNILINDKLLDEIKKEDLTNILNYIDSKTLLIFNNNTELLKNIIKLLNY